MTRANMPLSDHAALAALPPYVLRRAYQCQSACGKVRTDHYFWLRDDERKHPEIIRHLDAENRYADSILALIKGAIADLHAEMKARIRPDDTSVPFLRRGWWYYKRFRPGEEYPLYARQKESPVVNAQSIMAAISKQDFGEEHVLLDTQALAQGQTYYALGDIVISPDNTRCAWTQDTLGRRQYTLYWKDIDTGDVCAQQPNNNAPDLVWANDNQTIFYVRNDEKTLLSKYVMKHVIASSPASDRVVYTELDDSYYLSLSRTRDERFILIHADNTDCNEVLYFPADLSAPVRILQRRQPKLEYYPDHFDGRWVIRTNADQADNFKLVTTATEQCEQSHWRDWVAHDAMSVIEDFVIYESFVALEVRAQGLLGIDVIKSDGQRTALPVNEPTYTLELDHVSAPYSSWLRYRYTSLTTPETVYEYCIDTGKQQLLKQQSVKGYVSSDYRAERLWLPVRDGVSVPVSLVYHKRTALNGQAALYLYAYGSYGICINPRFDLARLSLIDRGCVFAIAHVRGGSDLGRQWYEAGRQHAKQNTFNDFIDVTRELIARGYAAADRVVAAGGSAGGLLMGVIANQVAALYTAIVAHVPFVDVVTTMLDDSIPLTTNEYEEWGNPMDANDYEVMLSYSPYDHVVAQAYPALYVTTGLYDSQVQYWEPVKWVAKLRHLTTSTKPILCRVQMTSGHSGQSGRLARYHDIAEEYVFVLDQLGCLHRHAPVPIASID